MLPDLQRQVYKTPHLMVQQHLCNDDKHCAPEASQGLSKKTAIIHALAAYHAFLIIA
jgi:hypothetical protein